MIDRFRLPIPDFLETSLYWSSCRAALALTTSLGLQVTLVLVIGIGPLAETSYDPAALTEVGRFMLTVEYDTQAYAAGCLVTVFFACAGVWAWNRMLFRAGPDLAQATARRGAYFMLGLAGSSFAAFWAVIVWIGPGLADPRRVAALYLLLLAAPTMLTLVILAAAYGITQRAPRGRSR